jgi:hypothetical protein
MRLAALALWLGAALPAVAQPSAGISLSGRIAHPRTVTPAELAAAPVVAVAAPSSKPGAPATKFTGALLWPLLESAGWVDLPGRKMHLQHVIMVRGADGYTVALSIAEIDPAFEGKPVIIAGTQDGKPLASPELVVPGDHRAGRRVHDVVAIDVQ